MIYGLMDRFAPLVVPQQFKCRGMLNVSPARNPADWIGGATMLNLLSPYPPMHGRRVKTCTRLYDSGASTRGYRAESPPSAISAVGPGPSLRLLPVITITRLQEQLQSQQLLLQQPQASLPTSSQHSRRSGRHTTTPKAASPPPLPPTLVAAATSPRASTVHDPRPRLSCQTFREAPEYLALDTPRHH